MNAAVRRPDHPKSSVICRTAFKDSGKFFGYLWPVFSMDQLKELFITTAESQGREPKERMHLLVPIHRLIVRMQVPCTHPRRAQCKTKQILVPAGKFLGASPPVCILCSHWFQRFVHS